MKKAIEILGKVSFCIAMAEYIILLLIEICITQSIRAIQKYILKDERRFKSFCYFIVKFSIFIAMKVGGVNYVITMPVDLLVRNRSELRANSLSLHARFCFRCGLHAVHAAQLHLLSGEREPI
jgi:hypothetical protein